MSESVAAAPSGRDFCLKVASSRYDCALLGMQKTILRGVSGVV
jgi:hypothetical protein